MKPTPHSASPSPSLRFAQCLWQVIGSERSREGSTLESLDSDDFLPESERERAFFTALESSTEACADFWAGIDDPARTRLLGALELGRRYAQHLRARESRPPHRHLPDFALAAARVPENLRRDTREWLGFLPHFRSGETGRFCVVERGVRTHVNVDPAELFTRILVLRPVAFHLFHNHPSGDLTPSAEDRDLTRRVEEVSRKLGIRLLGHGIVGATGESRVDVL